VISGTPFTIVENVDAAWPQIAPLVAGVDPVDNAGDDLWRECREGRALCLTSEDGLLVVSLQPSWDGSGTTELFVRMAVARGSRGTIQRNEAHLDAIAREMGATKIAFHTLRRGMSKALNPAWAERYTAFERAVNGS
jgi:hypothetical protein